MADGVLRIKVVEVLFFVRGCYESTPYWTIGDTYVLMQASV